MSNCCPSNGAAWDTPVPAPTTIVPPGTQVLATPVAYSGCGCSSGAASAVTGGAVAGAAGALVSIYPVLKQAAEVPAVGGIFQIYSTGASQWAVAGMQIWFPPFGYGEITGVTGDLIAVKNLSLPPGMVLQAGSTMVATPPPIPVVTPELEIPTLNGYFKHLTPRVNIYSQVRTGGAAWTEETVNRDLRTYQKYDEAYKSAMLTVEVVGYTLTRSFDIYIEINDIVCARAVLGQPNASDSSLNQVIVQIPESKLVKIAAKEFTGAGGTYATMIGNVYLDAFLP